MARLGGKPFGVLADAHEVTALAASRFGLPVSATRARASQDAPRASAWSEPEPWIVAVLLVTGVAVVARHPLARVIGTEVDDTTMTPSVVATAPPTAGGSVSAPAAAALAAPVPTHSPRNPFRALVEASSPVLAADAGAAVVGTATTTTTTTTAVTPAQTPSVHRSKGVAASTTCAGTMHTVVPGDTLWTLAARTVKSNDTQRITVVWHRIYKMNTPPLGSNPSLLPVGTKLCLPS